MDSLTRRRVPNAEEADAQQQQRDGSIGEKVGIEHTGAAVAAHSQSGDERRRRGYDQRDNETKADTSQTKAKGFDVSINTAIRGTSVVVLAILLRSGFLNLLLTPLCAALLLLNPWVRTFLDLKPVHGSEQSEQSLFDPARIVRRLTGQDPGGKAASANVQTVSQAGFNSSSRHKERASVPLDRNDAYAALRRMPDSLRRPLSDLEELIIRDCLCTWYNYHSFGEQTFPNEARFSIDHGIGSVYDAMEKVRSADITAELLLAAASVLLVTLRYRRLHPNSAPIFVNDQQRIQALREALDRVFVRHLKREDGQCDIMRTLLREILSKQIWNAICGIGDPDFINQQIVQWHERSHASADERASTPTVNQQQQSGYVARNGAVVTAPSLPQVQNKRNSGPPPLPQRTSPQLPDRRSSPAPLSSRQGTKTPVSANPEATFSEKTAKSTLAADVPKRPAPLTMPSANGSEPRTTQPKAMTMPSPLSRTTAQTTSVNSPTSSSPAAGNLASPFGKSSRSNSSNANTVGFFASRPSSATDLDFSPTRQSSPSKASTSTSMGPPMLPARKEQHARQSSASGQIYNHEGRAPNFPRISAPAGTAEDTSGAWDDLMPMNIPPRAQEEMHLPQSIRESIRADVQGSVEGHRSDARPSQDGYRIDESRGERLSADAESRLSIDGGANRPSHPPRNDTISPSARSSASWLMASDHPHHATSSKPPSRATSAASGGIPPAPELTEVLSNRPSSAVYVGLRDAFESFLERGGAANRSLFFSPPSAATVAPGEGEALLKLHLGLSAISRLVSLSQNGEDATDNLEQDANTTVSDPSSQEQLLFREDAANILQKGLQSLLEVDDDGIAGRALRDASAHALRRLQTPGDTASIQEMIQPVEEALWTRLHGLYEHFWKETCTRPAGGRPSMSSAASGTSTPARESFSPEPHSVQWKRSSREVRGSLDMNRNGGGTSGAGELNYEPRRKQPSTRSPAAKLAQLPPQSSMQAPMQNTTESAFTRDTGSPARLARPTPKAGIPRDLSPPPTLSRFAEAAQPQAQSQATEQDVKFDVTVTDVSPNANRPNVPVDLRTFEVMIAVEGMIPGMGGFVLVRQWKDFQQLNDELMRSASLPALQTPFPDAKGKRSEVLTNEIQAFLREMLSSPSHMTSDAVLYFVDKARAGEEASADRMGVLLDGLQMGGKGLSTLASGVVSSLQKGTRAAVTRASSFPAQAGLEKKPTLPSRQFQSVTERARPLSHASHADNNERRHSSDDKENDVQDLLGAAQEGDEMTLGPQQLAHLPIGVRKSHREETRSTNDADLGIPSSRKAPADFKPVSPLKGSAALHTSRPQSPAMQTPSHTLAAPSEISQNDLDNLLSCIFAIADEAFNLSGGWTFRRGMLRVFEQIVRTQYWSSILGVFNSMAHSLNHEQLGTWCTDAKVKFWPDEPMSAAPYNGAQSTSASQAASAATKASTNTDVTSNSADAFGDAIVEAAKEASQSGPSGSVEGSTLGQQQEDDQSFQQQEQQNEQAQPVKRSLAQRVATHQRAQAILLSHIPASSAIFMGPGGRQSCERAVMCIHEEICSPSTSMDLVLTVVLKLCDIIAR